MFQILIADSLAAEGPDFLAAHADVTVTVQTGLAGADLARALHDHDGVVVRSAVQVTGDVLEQAVATGGRLRAIARAGVGVDNIDLDAATRCGIAVMNSASASTITTAEHAFALMIALARNIGSASAAMRGGGWDRKTFVGNQLHGRTLGVVGFGRIGRTLAERALAFGMHVVAHDPFINIATGLDGKVRLLPSFDELVERADIISFHVPRTETTAGMMGRAQFERAKPGLLLVNAARGGIIDTAALLEALDRGQCGGAAIDVFESEPPPADDPLRSHPKVLLTPHLGASTVEAQEAVAVDACRCLLTYLRGEGLEGAVNAGGLNLEMNDRQRAFVDLSRRMVALLQASAGPPGLHRAQFTVRGEHLAGKADTLARFALTHLLSHHLAAPVSIINAPLVAEERGIETETRIATEHGEDRLAIEITHDDHAHRVNGAIFEDGRPRITHLDGYAMDMVPEGHMVLLTNVDQPGRIGLVGKLFGDANVNIAEMVIGRRPGSDSGEPVAMMILKLDEAPDPALLDALRSADGILAVAAVTLGPAN
ncbi:MAG: phosphoglycerate dehydrogenase [Planctomycetota bacterium]|jgi:D-3-phosphoglycerate dehydrogenase